MLPLQLRAAHPQSASQLPASALLLVCLVSLFQVAHNSHSCKYLHLFHHDKPPFTTGRAGSSCCAQGWGRSTASSLPTRTILCFNGWQTPNSQAPLQHSSPSAPAQHTEQLRPLTSARRRFARRAGGQLSDGGTDCLCGMSWGLYSLSFVSLVRSGFCRHCRDTIGNRIASLLPPLLLGALC